MGQIKDFYFKGKISASKSLMNRALIAQSFFEDLFILGHSQCEDVLKMRESLFHFQQGEAMDCGAAGTTLRFLMARVSREEGEFYLHGDQRLFERPHKGLVEILNQLGARVDYPEKNFMRIRSQGWNLSQPLLVNMEKSSQFASALLLSAWKLPKRLELQLSDTKNSLSYLQMTVEFLKKLGMDIQFHGNSVIVEAEQKVQVEEIGIEPDMSSCFSIAAIAASSGEAVFEDFPLKSLQPDFIFIEILKKLSVPVEYFENEKCLVVKKAQQLQSIEIDLQNNPDLFPVLSALLIDSQGLSEISGVDHLIYKESDRLQNTMDLINSVGGSGHFAHQKFYIQGKPGVRLRPLTFNPDKDHRMAMAAAVLNSKGANVEILDKEVVNKSFPEFWQILESQ